MARVSYVTFGEATTGWPGIHRNQPASAHCIRVCIGAGIPTARQAASGGGGAAIDPHGGIFVVTGANFGSLKAQPHDWTQSVLQFSDERGVGSFSAAPILRSTMARRLPRTSTWGAGACLLPALGRNTKRGRRI